MDRVRCEINGCTEPAHWRRPPLTPEDREHFLCTKHWQELRETSWATAGHYWPMQSFDQSRQANTDHLGRSADSETALSP